MNSILGMQWIIIMKVAYVCCKVYYWGRIVLCTSNAVSPLLFCKFWGKCYIIPFSRWGNRTEKGKRRQDHKTDVGLNSRSLIPRAWALKSCIIFHVTFKLQFYLLCFFHICGPIQILKRKEMSRVDHSGQRAEYLDI